MPGCRGCYPLPNQARYQLRYTRIFNFCHYTTAGEKIKDFPVCGHLCGQRRFCAAFCNRGKSRKCRRRKALRRFALPRPEYSHGTPKPGAIPTSLYPDIHFSVMIPRRAVKIKFFLWLSASRRERIGPCTYKALSLYGITRTDASVICAAGDASAFAAPASPRARAVAPRADAESSSPRFPP